MENVSSVSENRDEYREESSHVQIIAEGSPNRVLKSDLEFVALADDRDPDVSVSQDVELEAGRKKKVQRYRRQWEHHPSLKGWVAAVPDNPFRAWCTRCCCHLVAQLKVLLDHSLCRKHIRRIANHPPSHHPPQTSPTLTAASTSTSQSTSLTDVLGANSSAVELSTAECMASGAGAGAAFLAPSIGWCRSVDERVQQPDVQFSDSHRVTLSAGVDQMRVGFIGAGKIAQAVAMGLMNKGIVLAGKMTVSSATMKNNDIWKCWKCNLVNDNAEVVRQCDVVFLVVPPDDLPEALSSLELVNDTRARCFVSLVTGVTHARLTELLQERLSSDSLAVVRCVCTRTVAIGEGVCVYFASTLSHSWLVALETMFTALGMCHRVRHERLLNVYSGAFGGGVAFAAQFIDALTAGAVGQGVGWDEAVQMAAQTVQGAASMILSQGTMTSDLKRECCTPGGSTLSGVVALHQYGLEFAVMSAVEAATKKCHEIGATI